MNKKQILFLTSLWIPVNIFLLYVWAYAVYQSEVSNYFEMWLLDYPGVFLGADANLQIGIPSLIGNFVWVCGREVIGVSILGLAIIIVTVVIVVYEWLGEH